MSKAIQYKFLYECVAEYILESGQNPEADEALFNDETFNYTYEEVNIWILQILQYFWKFFINYQC